MAKRVETKMRITKTDLKEMIVEVLNETNGAQGDPQGMAAVKEVITFMRTKVFAIPAMQTKLEVIKRNPTALAQLQANMNKLLGIGEEDIASAAQRTRQQQKALGLGSPGAPEGEKV